MYCAGPPDDARDPGDGGPLRIRAAGRRSFVGSSAAALDPTLTEYLSDMVRPYGMTVDQDLLGQGSGHSYGEMAAALIAETIPADQPVDLIVLAFSIHDVVPGRSTAAYLSHLRPDQPMAFAVCDQGAATPFTALRLIGAYAQTGSCQRALLVTVEQAALHYDLAAPAAVPARHAAVMLLLGDSGSGQVQTVRLQAGLSPERCGPALASELAALSAGRADVTLIAGNGLSGLVDTAAVSQLQLAPAGQPCTGVWWELAGGLPGWAEQGRRVLLADYDPVLGYLGVAAIDVEASQPARPPLPRLSAHRAQ